MASGSLLPYGPALLGVSEIENRSVMEDVINQPELRDLNLRIVHHDSPDPGIVETVLPYSFFIFSGADNLCAAAIHGVVVEVAHYDNAHLRVHAPQRVPDARSPQEAFSEDIPTTSLPKFSFADMSRTVHDNRLNV